MFETLLFQIVDLNKTPPFELNDDVPTLPIKIVNQLENDTILIGFSKYVKIISKKECLNCMNRIKAYFVIVHLRANSRPIHLLGPRARNMNHEQRTYTKLFVMS